MANARAFYMNYPAGSARRSARVTRVHVMREDGNFPGRSGQCGIHGWAVTNSAPVILDPIPWVLPDGLSWCSKCVHTLARRVMQS